MLIGKRKVLRIIDRVLHLLEHHTEDVGFSSFGSVAEAVETLRGLRRQAAAGDRGCLEPLTLLFAPTGDLQDIALFNGWHDEYMELAARYDRY